MSTARNISNGESVLLLFIRLTNVTIVAVSKAVINNTSAKTIFSNDNSKDRQLCVSQFFVEKIGQCFTQS
jgi:type VI protein secretion system component Hcp